MEQFYENEYEDLGPLPEKMESEARDCLDLLVEHIVDEKNHKKINDKMKKLRYFSSKRSHHSNSNIGLKVEGYFNYDAIFEENAHFLRSCLRPKEEHIKEIEEFYGFLGRYIGKELLEQKKGKTFSVLSFNEQIKENLVTLKNFQKEYDVISEDVDILRELVNFSIKVDRPEFISKNDSTKLKKNLVDLSKKFRAFENRRDYIDDYINVITQGINSYLDAANNLMKKETNQESDFKTYFEEFKKARKELIKIDKDVTHIYKESSKLLSKCNIYAYKCFFELLSHARGYLAAEKFVKRNKDFMAKSKEMFYFSNKQTESFINGNTEEAEMLLFEAYSLIEKVQHNLLRK